jgi:hypothetical protein
MREAFRHDITLPALLEAVVADGGGSVQRFFDVTGLEQL